MSNNTDDLKVGDRVEVIDTNGFFDEYLKSVGIVETIYTYAAAILFSDGAKAVFLKSHLKKLKGSYGSTFTKIRRFPSKAWSMGVDVKSLSQPPSSDNCTCPSERLFQGRFDKDCPFHGTPKK